MALHPGNYVISRTVQTKTKGFLKKLEKTLETDWYWYQFGEERDSGGGSVLSLSLSFAEMTFCHYDDPNPPPPNPLTRGAWINWHNRKRRLEILWGMLNNLDLCSVPYNLGDRFRLGLGFLPVVVVSSTQKNIGAVSLEDSPIAKPHLRKFCKLPGILGSDAYRWFGSSNLATHIATSLI